MNVFFLNVYNYEIQTVIMYIVRVHSTIQFNQFWIKVLVLEHLNSAFKEHFLTSFFIIRSHMKLCAKFVPFLITVKMSFCTY